MTNMKKWSKRSKVSKVGPFMLIMSREHFHHVHAWNNATCKLFFVLITFVSFWSTHHGCRDGSPCNITRRSRMLGREHARSKCNKHVRKTHAKDVKIFLSRRSLLFSLWQKVQKCSKWSDHAVFTQSWRKRLQTVFTWESNLNHAYWPILTMCCYINKYVMIKLDNFFQNDQKVPIFSKSYKSSKSEKLRFRKIIFFCKVVHLVKKVADLNILIIMNNFFHFPGSVTFLFINDDEDDEDDEDDKRGGGCAPRRLSPRSEGGLSLSKLLSPPWTGWNWSAAQRRLCINNIDRSSSSSGNAAKGKVKAD